MSILKWQFNSLLSSYVSLSGGNQRYYYFWYKAAWNRNGNGTVEKLDLENISVAIGILSLAALEPEIGWSSFAPFGCLRYNKPLAVWGLKCIRGPSDVCLLLVTRMHCGKKAINGSI